VHHRAEPIRPQHVRFIDRVAVGDRPEGLAINPKGDVAVAVILAGSNNKPAYFYHRNGSLAVLRIDGRKVTKIKDIEVGGLRRRRRSRRTAAISWSAIISIETFRSCGSTGTTIRDTGKRFKVPGHPASARMSPR
jgi:hypothetical protein